MSFEQSDTGRKVYEAIAQKLHIDAASITPSSTLQDLGADSLDIVELIMRFEEMFGIEINDEDAEKLHNVGQVIAYIDGLRHK
jgi:acyl carrier protein